MKRPEIAKCRKIKINKAKKTRNVQLEGRKRNKFQTKKKRKKGN